MSETMHENGYTVKPLKPEGRYAIDKIEENGSIYKM